jgi:nucleoid DNA-binding protein
VPHVHTLRARKTCRPAQAWQFFRRHPDGNALNAVIDTIVKTVAKKQDVQLIGFGTFKAAKRAARTGKNPRTGEKLKIAAATVPKFSAGAAFKAAVNKKK